MRGLRRLKTHFRRQVWKLETHSEKTRYYLDSCASRIADTTGQNHKRTASHDNYNCYRNQPSPSDASTDCVVGIRLGGFRLYKSWGLFHETVHEGPNGFWTGRLAISLISLSFLLTAILETFLQRCAVGRQLFNLSVHILQIITWGTHKILRWDQLYTLLI
jgi:hypothetical protein